jgi:hypothetical protein
MAYLLCPPVPVRHTLRLSVWHRRGCNGSAEPTLPPADQPFRTSFPGLWSRRILRLISTASRTMPSTQSRTFKVVTKLPEQSPPPELFSRERLRFSSALIVLAGPRKDLHNTFHQYLVTWLITGIPSTSRSIRYSIYHLIQPNIAPRQRVYVMPQRADRAQTARHHRGYCSRS